MPSFKSSTSFSDSFNFPWVVCFYLFYGSAVFSRNITNPVFNIFPTDFEEFSWGDFAGFGSAVLRRFIDRFVRRCGSGFGGHGSRCGGRLWSSKIRRYCFCSSINRFGGAIAWFTDDCFSRGGCVAFDRGFYCGYFPIRKCYIIIVGISGSRNMITIWIIWSL